MTTLGTEIDAIMADVTGWTGDHAIGRRHLAHLKSPPYAVWVPTRGTPQPAMKVAGATRSIATRRLAFSVVLWCVDADALSDSIDALMAAVHRRWYGRWAYGGEDWIAEAAQTDVRVRVGDELRQRLHDFFLNLGAGCATRFVVLRAS